jgi:hypothetical protein
VPRHPSFLLELPYSTSTLSLSLSIYLSLPFSLSLSLSLFLFPSLSLSLPPLSLSIYLSLPFSLSLSPSLSLFISLSLPYCGLRKFYSIDRCHRNEKLTKNGQHWKLSFFKSIFFISLSLTTFLSSINGSDNDIEQNCKCLETKCLK